MKVLYFTDIHGDKNKYEKVIEIANREEINTIINGGDMLPKKGDRPILQKEFLKNYLPDYFRKLEKENLNYYVMLGNDDLEMFDEEFEQLCSHFSNIFNIVNSKFSIGDYEIIGMNKILDTPFPRKERIINEDNFQPDFKILPEGIKFLNNEYSYIRNWPNYLKTLPKMKDVLESLPKPKNPEKAIYVMHEPPARSNLGRIYSTPDHDVGSNDILEFIKEKQPLLTFHGHLHESPIVGGDFYKKVGNTICIQPGQSEFGEEDFIYVIIDLDKMEFSREIEKVI